MFKFLKGLFAKEITEEKSFSDIDEWFDNKLKEKLDLYEELRETFSSINSEIGNLKTNLDVLQKTELRNKEIPQRAIQLMEGNRESYIKKVHDFIQQIEVPEKNDLVNLTSFSEKISSLTDDIIKVTAKQYYVMQEFFANESRDIALGIKKIDEFGKGIKNLIDKDLGFKYIHDVREMIKEIERKLESEKNLKKQIEDEEAKLKETKAFKEKIETDIDNLETSSRFQAYSRNQSVKIQTEKDLKRHIENFNLVFSQVEKALKKYNKIAFDSDKEILNDYLISFSDALDNDRNFKILNLLKNVSYKINELELEDKKKDSTLKAIAKIDTVFLKDFLWKYDSLKNKLVDISKHLVSSTISNEINDLNYKLKHTGEQISKIEADIEKLKGNIDSLETENNINKLQTKLNKLAPVKIT